MQKTTYGLRHMPSGRILNVEARSNHDEDFCNAETCKLTLDDIDGGYVFRYETEKFTDLAQAQANSDLGWYNSSRYRPMLGDLDPEELHPVAFLKTYEFDAFGGDPIATTEVVLPVAEPEFITGHVVGVRDVHEMPKRVLNRKELSTHADALKNFDGSDLFMNFVTLLPTEAMPNEIQPGTGIQIGGANYTVLSETALPDTWPVETDEDLADARLLLVNMGIEPRLLDEYEQWAVPSLR